MRSLVHLLFLWCALLGADRARANVALRHDAEGNLTNDGRWSYWWDAENRLIRIESTTNIASIARQRIEFLYDALGRRVQKRFATNNAGTWVFQYTNRYIHDGDLIVAEVDHLNRPQRSYVWGPGDEIHGPALAMVIDHTAGSTGHFAVTDASGHVTDLIAAGSGAPSARYEYAPFGEMIRASGAFAALNPIRYASQFTDDETGQTAFRYRIFSPSSGRWLSRDPLGEIDGPNLYAYAWNDPVNHFDPLGLWVAADLGRAWKAEIHASRGVLMSNGHGIGSEAYNTLLWSAADLGEGVADMLLFGDALGTVSGNPCATRWDWAAAGLQDLLRGASLVGTVSGPMARLANSAKLGVLKGLSASADEIGDAVVAAERGAVRVFSSEGTVGGGRISLDEALAAAQRNGIDTRMFKLEYGGADPRYFGHTSFTPTDLTLESFKIVRAPDGRAIINLYDNALTSQRAAVETIAHEINHIRGVFKTGVYTSEEAAEAAARAAGQHFR